MSLRAGSIPPLWRSSPRARRVAGIAAENDRPGQTTTPNPGSSILRAGSTGVLPARRPQRFGQLRSFTCTPATPARP